MAGMDSDDDDRLILQIFPRSDPGRAVSYSGDQEFVRQVLRELSRRLEAGRATPQLQLVPDDGDEEGEG